MDSVSRIFKTDDVVEKLAEGASIRLNRALAKVVINELQSLRSAISEGALCLALARRATQLPVAYPTRDAAAG